ncbi:MAG TPA: CoA transferase [Syntrophorhabdaceae bacterium]|nr:CoA transferase [Syntrophorhabdaceae bacterium]
MGTKRPSTRSDDSIYRKAASKESLLLTDLRVLDCADEKGAFCSRLLADLGASVIKIEAPQGDGSRRIGPFSGQTIKPENSLFFAYHNANKLGITLDLNEEAGREIFRDLIKRTHVLVESFEPGYLKTAGLGFETLSRLNPGLVHAAITGFGQSVPGSRWRTPDIVASAFGGQMYVMGDPHDPPRVPYGEQSYYAASLFGAVRILIALTKRTQTGTGEYLDLSLQEAVASTLDHVMVRYFDEKIITKRRGNLYGNSFFCILPSSDGHIVLTLLEQWDTLVELMAAEGMAEDLTHEKFRDETYRIKEISHVIDVTARWTRSHSKQELFDTGQAMRFPWAPVCTPQDVLESPQLKARGFFFPADGHDGSAKSIFAGPPYKFSAFNTPRVRRAPLLGEHNRLPSEESFWPLLPQSHEVEQGFTRAVPFSVESGVLSGVRVLDFTRILAGPFATRILGDSGAEVIKVQSQKTATRAELNTSAYFNTWNRNKRSVTLDLSRREAREIVLKLAGMSDVVVENFSPRVMSNWNLSYTHFREVNSRIIMASISAMGQTGPWKDYVGYGPTFHALSGLTAMTSSGLKSPVGLGHAYADTIIGLYAALAILAALKHRDRTNEGQYIDLSGYEAVCTLMGPSLIAAGADHETSFLRTDCLDDIAHAPAGCYRCLGDDRWCVIAIYNDSDWRAFCRVADRCQWLYDEAFSSTDKRKEHRVLLDKLIEEWTCQYPPEAIVDLLQGAGVAAGVVENAQDLASDPRLVTRDFFVRLTHPVLGTSTSDRSALTFARVRQTAWKAAPLLGADNRYVFRNLLGLSEDELAHLEKKGVIA